MQCLQNDMCILRNVCIKALVMNGNAIDTEGMLHFADLGILPLGWCCVKCCTCKTGLVSPPPQPCAPLCVCHKVKSFC